MTNREYTRPLYAAAGVGDLLREELSKLPGRVTELRERLGDSGEMRGKVKTELAGLRERAKDATAGLTQADVRLDFDKVRRATRERAAAFAQAAQRGFGVAQDRASGVYAELVARGERAVRGEPDVKELPAKATRKAAPNKTTASRATDN